MSSVVELVRSWPLPRVIALAAIAVTAAACSDATRFDRNPYASQDTTASIQQQGAPAGRVQTSALPPPSASQPATMPPSGVSGGGQGMASYHPAQSPDPVTTGTVQSRQTQSPHSLPPPIRQSKTPATKAPASRIAPTQPVVHVVAPGETLYRIARKYKMSPADLARLNNIPPHTKLSIGDRLSIPASRTARAAQPETQKLAAQPKTLSAPPKSKAETKTSAKSQPKAGPVLASHQPTETASVATSNQAPAATNSVRGGNANLSFRWPAKGRIIAGFGPKTNGQTNDGINIALPEGTPVKAAEDGVVAYAGNELKGYGNLVLVRHADGYVTAYAHARELLVKRGDPIKRGQTIARSGQTGNVDAPQLHFEIRKGPAPIDPMPHLSGG